jgi:hypothetical protein
VRRRGVSCGRFRPKLELTGHPLGSARVWFSPDGKRVALGGANRAGVKVWDLADLLPAGK